MKIVSSEVLSQYNVEKDWVGPFDEEADCIFNISVGCKHPGTAQCARCGHNPIVSGKRLCDRFGEGAYQALTIIVE